jgi:hypothetical protein
MALPGSTAGLRAPARWVREAGARRTDEDWAMVAVGVLVVVVTIGLAVLGAWTVHQRDFALRDAAAAAGRLRVNGLDDQLYQRLVTFQQDESVLFQDHVDTASQEPLGAGGQDPAAGLAQVEATLAEFSARFSGSPAVLRDISLISRETAQLTSLEAYAQAYNQQGLPVGSAYLRELSGYLSQYTLPSAENIRELDQARLSADDAHAARLPWLFLAAALAGLACLAWAQVRMARYTRRLLNPGLVLATVLTVIGIAWPVTVMAASGRVVAGEMAPHAREAAALARARLDGIEDHDDDQLTLLDHDEDCATAPGVLTGQGTYTYQVTCSFEHQVLSSLQPRGRGLRADLAAARLKAPDRAARAQVSQAAAAVAGWRAAELALPTMQNVGRRASQGGGPGSFPRYGQAVRTILGPLASADPFPDESPVISDAAVYQAAVQRAMTVEWADYDQRASQASGVLTGAVIGVLLLGLAAGAAAGSGVGWRVAEYWSAGRRPT